MQPIDSHQQGAAACSESLGWGRGASMPCSWRLTALACFKQHTRRSLRCSLQVLRDGQRQTIPAEELVPGDIVLIKSGDKVPADVRLVTCNNLQVRTPLLPGLVKQGA